MLAIVLAIAVSTAAGLWAHARWGESVETGTRRSLLFVLYVVLPPVTFFNLADTHLDADASAGIGLALLSLAILAGIAYLVGSRLLRLSRPAIGSLIVCTLVVNTGFLGYAVVAALVDFDALGEAAAFDVLVSGPALLLGAFAAGAAFGADAGETSGDRVRAFFLRNPVLYAAIAGLLVPDSFAPEAIVEASRIAVVAILPLGFFAVGAALGEEADAGVLGFPPRFDAPIAVAVALRLIGGPLLLLAITAPLIDLPDTYLLLAAMPSGINSMIVTHAYGLDLRITAGAVAWSTAILVIALTVGGAVGLV